VSGSASKRITGISIPHLIHGRIVTSGKSLLDGSALNTGFTVFVHTTLLQDTTIPTERLADVRRKPANSSRLTLGFHIETIKASLGHIKQHTAFWAACQEKILNYSF
jgi:hypothetical protein